MKKRPDGRYQRKITLNGKTEYIYGKTMKEVNERYSELTLQKAHGVEINPQDITVEQLCRMWLQNEKEGNIADWTYYQYGLQFKHAFKYIGNIKVQKLTTFDIERMRAGFKAEDCCSTFNAVLPMLRKVLNYAINHDIIIRNVTTGVSLLKYTKAQKRALTPFEVMAIQKAPLNVWQRAWVDILYYTGIRRGELLALTVKDIDYKKNVIHINKTTHFSSGEIQYHTKTQAGMRDVYLPDALRASLRAWTDIVGTGLLFCARNGSPLTVKTSTLRWQEIVKVIFPEGGPEDFTPHLFRHNYASSLYKAGVDLKAAQYLLGHNDIKTTMNTYTHFGRDDVDVSKIDIFFNGCQKGVNEPAKPRQCSNS